MTESRPSLSTPGPVRTEDIATVGELRAVLALIPDDAGTGPYFAEWSPSDNRFDLHPTTD
jgi:hypothetical protein